MGCKNVPGGGGGNWPCCCCGHCAELDDAVVDDVVIPRRALSSSLQIGCPPPLLELSTSDTPLSAGLGGNEPGIEQTRN